jgi:integrase
MARPSGVWFREADGWWYTTVRGVQHRLTQGGTKTAAREELHKLLAALPKARPASPKAAPSLRYLCDVFLEDSQKANAPETYRWHVAFLQGFLDFAGNLPVSALKKSHLHDWLASEPGWGSSTQALAAGAVIACLNWHVKRDRLAANPLAGFRRPPVRVRNVYLAPGDRARVLAAARKKFPPFGDYLRFLELTGCRPYSEAARLTAAEVDLAVGLVSLGEHKNKKKGKARTIYCAPEALEILRRLAVRHPAGLLFRNFEGTAWSDDNAGPRLRRLGRKFGVKGLTPYAYRHTFITDCLARGLSASVVAELVGSSVATISKHYEHLSRMPAVMLKAAARAASPPPPPTRA